MVRIIQVILLFFFLTLTVLLGNYFDQLFQQEKITQTQIRIYPVDKNFIEQDEIASLIDLNDSIQIKNEIKKLEEKLEKNDFIDNAEVFQDLNGNLKIRVEQFKPLARIVGNSSYYIDEQGHKKPLSDHYTERVPLVRAVSPLIDHTLIVPLIKKINKDKFLKETVSEIYIKSNQEVIVKLDKISADFLLELNPKIIDEELFKLKVIYNYVLQKKLENKYKFYFLQYDNQVVCKK